MRNRNLIINKIEHLEGFLKTLRFIVERREPLETYLSYLSTSEETLSDIKSLIESQDLSPNELNKI